MDEKHLRVGDDVFTFGYPFPPEGSSRTPPILKQGDRIEQLANLLQRTLPERIVEIGIKWGGSTAFIASLVRPKRMVAIELSKEPVFELQRFLEERQLGDLVTPLFGVDQADTAALAAILDDTFAGEPIDLVIDDASHRYRPTRRCFELIFPRLRSGGLFIIEDWAGEHQLAVRLIDKINRRVPGWESLWQRIQEDLGDEDRSIISVEDQKTPRLSTLVRLAKRLGTQDDVVPLSRLGVELFCASADSLDVIRRIEVTQGFFIVERGEGEVPEGPWLDTLSMDMLGVLS